MSLRIKKCAIITLNLWWKSFSTLLLYQFTVIVKIIHYSHGDCQVSAHEKSPLLTINMDDSFVEVIIRRIIRLNWNQAQNVVHTCIRVVREECSILSHLESRVSRKIRSNVARSKNVIIHELSESDFTCEEVIPARATLLANNQPLYQRVFLRENRCDFFKRPTCILLQRNEIKMSFAWRTIGEARIANNKK